MQNEGRIVLPGRVGIVQGCDATAVIYLFYSLSQKTTQNDETKYSSEVLHGRRSFFLQWMTYVRLRDGALLKHSFG